jgi:diaminopimelate epimerase
MRFFKYHALGNDYVVLDPADFPDWKEPTAGQIRVICHRNFGLGSDGILWGPLPRGAAAKGEARAFGLRIFNPDGSEAEKSGNGARIFARFLWDRKLAKTAVFDIQTPGGAVQADVRENGRLIVTDMGRVSFSSEKIPVKGPGREVLNEKIEAGGRVFTFCAATIGNPHCVIVLPEISPELARRHGPLIEVNPLFPNRTNVQFLQVLDRANIRIEIWERGAGHTLASGTSASASAAVARRLGLIAEEVTVHMPGGSLGIRIGDDYSIRMTGTVNRVAEGSMHPELFEVKV